MFAFITAAFRDADFRADAALVRQYTGVELSRQVFDLYYPRFTLSSKMGTAQQLERDYHGYGVPRGVGNGDICARLLHHLADAGILLPSGPGTPLGNKLSGYLGACVSANQWLSLPETYFKPHLPDDRKMRETWFWLAGTKPA